MYGQIPYMFPGTMMQAAPTSAMISPTGLGTTLGAAKTGATSLLGKINWSSLLSNAQKTLNVVNQAIPLYYQVKPVFQNIKTLGKIGKEFTKLNGSQNNSQPNNVTNTTNNVNQTNSEEQTLPEPTFFL